jgi:hypothetical protein
MASWAIVDQTTPLLPNDNEQAMGKVKQPYALIQPVFVQEVGNRG